MLTTKRFQEVDGIFGRARCPMAKRNAPLDEVYGPKNLNATKPNDTTETCGYVHSNAAMDKVAKETSPMIFLKNFVTKAWITIVNDR